MEKGYINLGCDCDYVFSILIAFRKGVDKWSLSRRFVVDREHFERGRKNSIIIHLVSRSYRRTLRGDYFGKSKEKWK